jgi:predicted DNA-binding ribbon-helix-helix protein
MLNAERNGGNLSSTIRVFVLNHHLNTVASNQILRVKGSRSKYSSVSDVSLTD